MIGSTVYKVHCKTMKVLTQMLRLGLANNEGLATDMHHPMMLFRLLPKYRNEYSMRLRKIIADEVRAQRKAEGWRRLKRGDTVKFGKPVGSEDKRIADMKMGRCATFIECTKPHGMARIMFYGDAKGLSYLVHPESLTKA